MATKLRPAVISTACQSNEELARIVQIRKDWPDDRILVRSDLPASPARTLIVLAKSTEKSTTSLALARNKRLSGAI